MIVAVMWDLLYLWSLIRDFHRQNSVTNTFYSLTHINKYQAPGFILPYKSNEVKTSSVLLPIFAVNQRLQGIGDRLSSNCQTVNFT